jgi:hypothetical protein
MWYHTWATPTKEVPVVTTAEQVRAEEREAMAQHRHMERMRREADRARLRREKDERRTLRDAARARRDQAQRQATTACRDYLKALTRYGRCPDAREEEVGREVDRAYEVARSAVNTLRRAEAELDALR